MLLKIRFLAILMLLSLGILKAQPPEKSKIYLSVSLGPSIASIKGDFGFYTFKASGPSLQMDLKAGFGLSDNLFLNVTYNVNKLSNPTLKVPNAYSPRPSDEVAISDRMFGGGFTWYPIPQMYLSVSAGPGTSEMIDRVNYKDSEHSDRGLAMQFLVGREWQISQKFGMGVCFTYGFTKTTNLTDRGNEELSGNRFGLLYSVSMH
jgi:hypothetical protein